MLRQIRLMLGHIRLMLSYIRSMLRHISGLGPHVEVHRTLANYRNPRESSHGRVQRLSKQQYIRLVLLDLLSVAVLIHHAEATQGRRVVLAVGLDKLCPQASLASMPFGGP